MALKSLGSGQRARANPTEALIPDDLLDYRDPYDGWRGDKPYIGLGNAVRDRIKKDLLTSVRWMLPGDLLDCSGLLRWVDAHFPGYDPFFDDGVYKEVDDAVYYLIKHGFLQRCNQENLGFIRTDKPPQVAYSVFGNEAVKYQLKRIAADREMLRGDITTDVVNTAYAEGPTREQYARIEKLAGVHGVPGVPHHLRLTDADFMNPTAEMIAHVATIKEHYRVLGEKAIKERTETEYFRARLERFKQTATPERKQAVMERARQLDSQRDRQNGEPFVRRLLQAMDELENESRPWG
jgi:hypothetical protein